MKWFRRRRGKKLPTNDGAIARREAEQKLEETLQQSEPIEKLLRATQEVDIHEVMRAILGTK